MTGYAKLGDKLFDHLLDLALDVAHLARFVAGQQVAPHRREIHAAQLIYDVDVRVLNAGPERVQVSEEKKETASGSFRAADVESALLRLTLLPSASVSYVKVNV